MRVVFEREKKEKELSFQGTVKELLAELGVAANTVLVVRGDAVLVGDDLLKEEDEVRILSVISGG